MARAKVVHSEDACTIIFAGDKSSPEPSTGIIKFPGGFVEVARTSDGKYWTHITIEGGKIESSRYDYIYEKWLENEGKIPPLPNDSDINHVALLVGR